MNFSEYLQSKKIDGEAFRRAEPARWQEWSALFEQVSEKSFTSQKLYLINPVRRKYLLKETINEAVKGAVAPVEAPKPKPGKPIIKPKIS